jgi:hypothetical protein
VNFGSGGDGVLAEKAEIKVHGVFHHAGVIADDKIDAGDSAGISLLSVLKRKGQYRFNNALFMHE